MGRYFLVAGAFLALAFAPAHGFAGDLALKDYDRQGMAVLMASALADASLAPDAAGGGAALTTASIPDRPLDATARPLSILPPRTADIPPPPPKVAGLQQAAVPPGPAGGYALQLASFRSAANAGQAVLGYAGRWPEWGGQDRLGVERAEVAGTGEVHRVVLSGFASVAEAESTCVTMSLEGACIVRPAR